MSRYTLLFSLLLLSLSSCVDKFANLGDTIFEDIQLEIATDVLANPVNLQFVDAATGQAVTSVEVQAVEASAFSGVYTLAGDADLSTTTGLLSIGVRKEEVGANTGVNTLGLRFMANGYQAEEQRFVVKDAEPELYTVYLSANEKTVVMSHEQRFNTERGNDLNISDTGVNFLLKIGAPTRFLDEDDDFMTGDGNIKLQLRPEEVLTDVSLLGMEEELIPFHLDPVFDFDLDITVEDQKVKYLSYPIQLFFPLTGNKKNPLTGKNIGNGDLLPSYSFNEEKQSWQTEQVAEVIRKDGQLGVQLELRHLSRWVIGFSEGADKDQCQILISMEARDIPDTLQVGKLTYTHKPRYSVFQIVDGCMTGTNFNLDAFIRSTVETAQQYFEIQDGKAFSGLTFQRDIEVYFIETPVECSSYQPEEGSIPLFVNTSDELQGEIRYAYGDLKGALMVTLNPGLNRVDLPLPKRPLQSDDTGLGRQAQIGFSMIGNCNRLSDETELSECELAAGYTLNLMGLGGHAPQQTQLSVESACNNSSNDLVIRPSLPVFYREHCPQTDFNPFQPLATIADGQFSGSVPLTIGRSYDFAMTFGGIRTVLEEVAITNEDKDLLINGQIVLIRWHKDTLNLDLGEVEIPDSICEIL